MIYNFDGFGVSLTRPNFGRTFFSYHCAVTYCLSEGDSKGHGRKLELANQGQFCRNSMQNSQFKRLEIQGNRKFRTDAKSK